MSSVLPSNTAAPLSVILLAVFLNGLAGLGGGLLPTTYLKRHLGSLLALASGVLVGTAFLDLLPEALEHIGHSHEGPKEVLAAALIGFLAFYVIEASLGSHATGQTGHRHDTVGPLILVGDALHNITDGLAITAAFLVDQNLGWITTLTVIVHELPQEIADYTILISQGWPKSKALLATFVVQLSAFIGVASGLWFASPGMEMTPYLLAFSAGGFIYVAAADLLPQMQAESLRDGKRRTPLVRMVLFLFGIALMGMISSHHH